MLSQEANADAAPEEMFGGVAPITLRPSAMDEDLEAAENEELLALAMQPSQDEVELHGHDYRQCRYCLLTHSLLVDI